MAKRIRNAWQQAYNMHWFLLGRILKRAENEMAKSKRKNKCGVGTGNSHGRNGSPLSAVHTSRGKRDSKTLARLAAETDTTW